MLQDVGMHCTCNIRYAAPIVYRKKHTSALLYLTSYRVFVVHLYSFKIMQINCWSLLPSAKNVLMGVSVSSFIKFIPSNDTVEGIVEKVSPILIVGMTSR